jgi:hypothetical protein
MILYKYLRADTALKVLESRELAFTPPERFNDPFECLPHVTAVATSEGLADIMSAARAQLLADGWDELPDWARSRISKEQYLQLLDRTIPLATSLMDSGQQMILDLAVRPVLKGVRRSIGILSLSEVNDSMLMWAYYADSYAGIVIGFDSQHAYFDQRLGPEDDLRYLRRVEYRPLRPHLAASDLDGIEIYLVKSHEWSHEKEWRIAQPLSAASTVEPTPYGSIYLFSFPTESVRSVILGSRVTPAIRENVSRLMDSERYAHAALLEVHPHENEFRLELRVVRTGHPSPPWLPSQQGG